VWVWLAVQSRGFLGRVNTKPKKTVGYKKILLSCGEGLVVGGVGVGVGWCWGRFNDNYLGVGCVLSLVWGCVHYISFGDNNDKYTSEPTQKGRGSG